MNTQGEHVIRFLEEFITLGGSFHGEPFKVLPFQRDVIEDIYRLDDDGKRQHRTYLLGLPRKNAKTTLAAALGVYHLIADTADKAPVAIAAAGDRQQARLVFDEVRRMCQSNEDLASVTTVYRNEVRSSRNGGTFRVVSADAGLQQGLNPTFVVIDEYHVHKNADLFDALTLGSATRSQPLTLVISTAGYELESPLGRLYRFGKKVKSGEVVDPSFGMTWWGPDDNEEYDPHDPAVWERFNPAFNEFMNVEEFESAHRRTAEAPFIRYRLNGWTKAESAWLPAGVFENLSTDRRLEPGERVVLGFDGAWASDSTALVACTIDEPRHLEVVGVWEKPDDQHAMGWRTPIHEVTDAIAAAFEKFNVVELTADPWRWELVLQDLSDEGFPVTEYPTNQTSRMVPATQAIYDAIQDGTLSHSGDPALVRHFRNCVLKEDARGGARLTKNHRGSTKKIDLAIASVIAHHRACSWREELVPTEPQLLIL